MFFSLSKSGYVNAEGDRTFFSGIGIKSAICAKKTPNFVQDFKSLQVWSLKKKLY